MWQICKYIKHVQLKLYTLNSRKPFLTNIAISLSFNIHLYSLWNRISRFWF